MINNLANTKENSQEFKWYYSADDNQFEIFFLC